MAPLVAIKAATGTSHQAMGEDNYLFQEEVDWFVEIPRRDTTLGTEPVSRGEEATKPETKEQSLSLREGTETAISQTETEYDKQFLKDIAYFSREVEHNMLSGESAPSPAYVVIKRKGYISKLKEDVTKLKTYFENEDKLAVYIGGLKETINQTMRGLLPLKDEGFLLIVSLIQDSLLGQGWRQYSKSSLDVISEILTSCSKSAQITLKDYKKALKLLHSQKIDTFPLNPSYA